jgi:uncharacterized C2H2 Zn-finger protein
MKIKKVEVKAKWGNLVITNEFWTCPSCKQESNYIEWFCTIEKTGETYHTCPKCKIVIQE